MKNTHVLNCPECGAPLVNVRSSASCPIGHGRIYPRITAAVRREAAWARYHKWRDSLPQANLLDVPGVRVYAIPGAPGFWQYRSRLSYKTDPEHLYLPGGGTPARWANSIGCFVPWIEGNEAAKKAGFVLPERNCLSCRGGVAAVDCRPFHWRPALSPSGVDSDTHDPT